MITVLMPCWILNEEGLQLTKEAIESVGKGKLILIDNGSSIGGGYLRSVADVYIRNKENLGYAKAVNQGLKLAGEELIAIINNDIRVSPNWREVTEEAFTNPLLFSLHLRMTDYDVPFKYGDKTYVTGKERWCQGSFFVIDGKKKQFYDEGLLNSYDDWDYFMRARKQGYYTAYTNKACFQHNHSFTQRLNPNRVAENQKNAEYFIKKWGKPAEELFAKQYPDQMAKDWKSGFDEGL